MGEAFRQSFYQYLIEYLLLNEYPSRKELTNDDIATVRHAVLTFMPGLPEKLIRAVDFVMECFEDYRE